MSDPTNSEQVEAVDHRARAEELAKAIELDAVLSAQVSATLALVDEVAKLRQVLVAMHEDSPIDAVVAAEEAQ